MNNVEFKAVSRRTVFSYWPFILWILPIFIVYVFGSFGHQDLVGRKHNEMLALPLVLASVVSYGLLALKKRNEFALLLTILSAGFFCREWHFAGTSKGVYAVIAFVGFWYMYRFRNISALIKDTKIEIWFFATALCYVMSQVIARRVFGENHFNILYNEAQYHTFFEESVETTAHLMLAVTSFVSWRLFNVKTSKKESYVSNEVPLYKSAG